MDAPKQDPKPTAGSPSPPELAGPHPHEPHDSREPPHTSWFPVFAPIIAWLLHAGLSTVVVLHACRTHRYPLVVPAVLLAGIVALVVALAGGMKSRAALRRFGVEHALTAEAHSTNAVLAQIGFWSSAVFALAIALDVLPVFLLRGLCEVGR